MFSVRQGCNAVFSTAYYNIEATSNYVIKKVKYTIAPLSVSLPLSPGIRIIDNALKLTSYLKEAPIFPNIAKSLEGTNDLLGVGSFISTVVGFIPCLPITNLDEDELKNSICLDGVDVTFVTAEKWKKRILKQVKASLSHSYTEKNIRKELREFLIGKGIGEEQADAISQSIHIQSKSRNFIEKIYTGLFLIPGINTAVRAAEKWELINIAHWSAKIGNLPIIGPVTAKAAEIGLRTIAFYAALTGLGVMGSYQVFKLARAEITIWTDAEDSAEYAKAVEERTKQIWNCTITTLSLAGMAVPLFVSVNPAVLLAYGIGSASISFANALRQQS